VADRGRGGGEVRGGVSVPAEAEGAVRVLPELREPGVFPFAITVVKKNSVTRVVDDIGGQLIRRDENCDGSFESWLARQLGRVAKGSN
jgi:hypothetical protein